MRQVAIRLLLPLIALCATKATLAVPTANVYTPIQAVPPNAVSVPARPAIMLNLSKDHQLFYRAYNEFTDYNDDDSPDGGYIHEYDYSGYFDPKKCYAYSNANRRFAPAAMANSQKFCTGQWSGNFLNWATMTRMDVVRKVLYGGHRSTDNGAANTPANLTVLQRASLPMDAHSFAKHHNNDIVKLTPFNQPEITLCNTTFQGNVLASGAIAYSHTTSNPPLLRVARGNFALWNAHERRQCRWSEELVWLENGAGNGNTPGVTGLAANNNYPSRINQGLSGNGATAGSAGDYEVKVEVCNAALLGTERCRRYPSGNYKPIGLLQEYGETDRAEFGLLTGSFSFNIAGGVLRKNVSSFRDEVNHTTDGTFNTAVINSTNSNVGSIVGTLNKIRVYGYRYSDGTYGVNTNPGVDGNCTFQLSGLTNDRCASWGNPIGEMYTEALRYFKGPPSSGTYGPANLYGAASGASTDPKGDAMGLPRPTWTDPFARGASINTTFGLPQCRAINIINFNASVTSYDNDTQAPFNDLGAGLLNNHIDAVGTGEGVNGTQRFVGRVNGAGDNACTAKMVGTLSQVDGLCPSGPAYRGSFSLAGAAFWAHTNPIRTMAAFPLTANLYGANKDPNFRVNTFSVALAPGLPRIEVNAPAGKAIIQPNYVLNDSSNVKRGNGTLVDFRVVTQTPTSGKYIVVWEDSEQGGDYDQDASGILEWNLAGNVLTVTTSTFADATDNPQGFGYTISGTNKNGVHYHSGIRGFTFNDPTSPTVTVINPNPAVPQINTSGGCLNCLVNQSPTRATYTVNGSAANDLQDPLFYAAKWGGFDVAASGDTPNTTAKWDKLNDKGLTVPDGIPDNYFAVFNPDQLEDALRRVFSDILATSNSSPAVSAGQLVQGSFKYIAEFDQFTQSGNVKAYPVEANGDFRSSPGWVLGETLQAVSPALRQVITNNDQSGLAFNWAAINLNPAYRGMLTGGTTTLSAGEAEALVNYMRGERSREEPVPSLPLLRDRPDNNIVGAVVNAAPWIQPRPSAAYFEADFPGYRDFIESEKGRTRLLWAASNDGMLHGVDSDDGVPVISYVPGLLAPRLNEQTRTGLGIRAFVDGSPFTGDVWIDQPAVTNRALEWRTYLFGSLGRGGRGIYALDVTSTANLTATNAANVFKWQFSADDDADLGYVTSDVSIKRSTNQAAPIVKLNNGQSAIIIGNGYQSTSGRAALMILPADGPSATGSWVNRFHKIVVDAAGPGNGLSTPTWVDMDNNGTADVVYAGDLRGNLWKFDISDANPANWRSAYRVGTAPTPLYIARDGVNLLPISAAPEATFPSFGGVMVTFATGLANVAAEFPRPGVAQRIYSIWDRPAFTATGAANRALPRNLGTLVARTYARQANGNVAITSAPTVDYLNNVAADAKDGWYVNLPSSSEMVLSNPVFRLGNIFMVSVRPNSNTQSCSQLPEATLYVFNPVTGVPGPAVLGTSGTNALVGLAIQDQKVILVLDATGRSSDYGGALASAQGGRKADVRVVGPKEDTSISFGLSDARIQWREIPGLRTQ